MFKKLILFVLMSLSLVASAQSNSTSSSTGVIDDVTSCLNATAASNQPKNQCIQSAIEAQSPRPAGQLQYNTDQVTQLYSNVYTAFVTQQQQGGAAGGGGSSKPPASLSHPAAPVRSPAPAPSPVPTTPASPSSGNGSIKYY